MTGVRILRDGVEVPRPVTPLDVADARQALLADLDAVVGFCRAIGFDDSAQRLGRLALEAMQASDAELTAEHERVAAVIVACVRAVPTWGEA